MTAQSPLTRVASSKVPIDAYRNAPVKIWIVHQDGSVNNTMVVFKWHNERGRLYMFRKAKQQLRNYRGAPIREVHFYENAPNGQLLGKMGADGTFYEGVEFMNSL